MLQISFSISNNFLSILGQVKTAVVTALVSIGLVAHLFIEGVIERNNKWYVTDAIGDENRDCLGGHCIEPNGTNQYIKTSHSNSLNVVNGDTIAFELKDHTFLSVTNVCLATKGREGNDSENYAFYVLNGKIRLEWLNSGWIRYETTNAVLTTGVKYDSIEIKHTFGDSASIEISVNGVVASGSWIGGTGDESPLTNSQDLYIGTLGTYGTYYYSGKMSFVDFKVNGASRLTYAFEEKVSPIVFDISDNANHGYCMNYTSDMRVQDNNLVSRLDTIGYSEAKYLDGSTSYIDLGDLSLGTNNFDLSIPIVTSLSSHQYIFGYYNSGTDYFLVQFNTAQGLYLELKGQALFQQGNLDYWKDNKPQFVRLLRADNFISVFLDEQFIGMITTSASLSSTSYRIGEWSGAFLKGIVGTPSLSINDVAQTLSPTYQDCKLCCIPAIDDTTDALNQTLLHQGRAKYSPQAVGSYCLGLNGTNNFISTPQTDDLSFGTEDWEIEVEAKAVLSDIEANFAINYGIGGYDAANYLCSYWYADKHINFTWRKDGVTAISLNTVNDVLVANQIHNVKYKRTGTLFEIIIDGVQKANTTISENLSAPDCIYDFIIGCLYSGGASHPFNGNLYKFKITKGSTVVLDYSFSKGTGNVVPDESGRGNNGAIQNYTADMWTTDDWRPNNLINAGKFDSTVESKIKLPEIKDLINADVSNFFFDTSGNAKEVGFSDMVANRGDQIFFNEQLAIYSQAQIEPELSQIKQVLNIA